MSNPFGPNAGSSIYEFLKNMVSGASDGDVPVWNSTTEQYEPGNGASAAPTAVIKSADEVVNNSDALQDDNELTWAVEAGKRYRVLAHLRYSATGTADVKVGWSVPAGATLGWNTTIGSANPSELSASGTAVLQANGTAALRNEMIVGTLLVDSTAGDLTIQWAQNVADASDTTVFEGSWLELVEEAA